MQGVHNYGVVMSLGEARGGQADGVAAESLLLFYLRERV